MIQSIRINHRADASVEIRQAALNKPLTFRLKGLRANHPYFAERGIMPETIAAFGLGVCQEGAFKHHIVIPIHNKNNELVAYARHRLVKSLDHALKYSFTPDFNKSLELFNLNRAIQESALMPLVVVESYFSLMKLWQHGVRRIVATMNDKLSPAQIKLIRQQTDKHSHVLLLFDENKAGRLARHMALQALTPYMFVKVNIFEEEGKTIEQLSLEEIALLFA